MGLLHRRDKPGGSPVPRPLLPPRGAFFRAESQKKLFRLRMVPPGIRGLVFDAIGTLIHPDPPAPVIYARVGQRFGSLFSPAVIGPRFTQAFDQEDRFDHSAGLQTSEAREIERWRHIVARVLDDVSDPAECFGELFAHFGRPQSWRTDPSAALVLSQLAREGYTLGIASNYDRRLRSVVAGLPELAPLQHLIISSEVGWRKPAPEFFAAVCRTVGLAPEQILYVGDDRANDYDGAQAAGLRAVLFDLKEREKSPTVKRIRRLRDLLPRE